MNPLTPSPVPPSPQQSQPRPTSGRRATAHLNRRYFASFAVAAALLLANQLLVMPPLVRLATDAPVINVAGRQRMLSQRLAKAALALAVPGTDRDARRNELRGVLALWTASHDGLRHGNRAMLLPGDNGPEVRAAFITLQPDFDALRAAAARLAAAPTVSPTDPSLRTILAVEGRYLTRMDRIVGMYEAAARGRARRLLWTGWLFTALVLAALAAIGRWVLLPAARLIGDQLAELRTARDRLEDRVRNRTAELEAANAGLARAAADLEREHAERLAAEERHRGLLERFGHAARINTMGEMATGLAHELNQPLGAVANYVGGCLEQLDRSTEEPDRSEAFRGALEKAQAAALRAGEIVRRIRRFATRHEFERRPVDPNALAAETTDFLRDEAARRGIPLQLDAAPDLPPVSGDAVQLQQVLVNLIRNALDAVAASQNVSEKGDGRQGGGSLVVVSTRREPDGGVTLAVTDQGEGIPADRLPGIFDRFFSTRAEGMGMGLAISRSLIEAHHGRIAATSPPGGPTTVWFTLPPAS